jgi:hypothetical protein
MATSETQTGLAKIFGLGSAAMTVLTGAATITISSADIEHQFDTAEDTDQEGNVETIVGFKERLAVTIDFYPNGATRAAAIASIANTKPAMLSKVVLASFDTAAYNGDYNYLGGWNVKTTREGIVVAGIKLVAHIANRTSLTTAVISG